MNNSHLMVDVGNSTINFGIFVDGKLAQSFNVKSDIDHVAKLSTILGDIIKDKSLNIRDFVGGLICSVVPSYNKNIHDAILKTFKIDVQIMDHSFFDDLKIIADNRKEVGFDLIADVVFTNTFSHYPCLIIDLGTITKYILVDECGTLSGVSFCPGIEVSFDSMRNATAQLPSIDKIERPNKLFGNNTNEALICGVFHSNVGAIKEFANKAESRYGKIKKILTGGLSKYFADEFKDFIFDENVTLKGIYEIYKKNWGAVMNYYSLMKPYKQEMVEKLCELLKIPSVLDEKSATSTMPFGKGVDDALKCVGKLGEQLGFKVDYCDGYATELTIGTGDKLISIFAHADVVPATGTWKYGPFEPTIVKNKLYARGSSDDKGPFIASLYAAKALFDKGLVNNYRIRLVVGGDEESGSRCLVHYFEKLKKENPTYGFTPDSDFPLIYGEKGITDFETTLKIDIPHVNSIKGGVVTNAVCDKVIVNMDKFDDFICYLKEQKIDFEISGNDITFIGKAVHGSTPELGKNAALIALKSLGDFYKIEKLSNIGEKLLDTSGKSFNGYSHSKLLGDTTYCVGIINYENGNLYFTVNFRFNELVNPEEFMKNLDKELLVTSKMDGVSKVLLFDPKCKMVKTMMKAYRAETHDRTKPLTTGGGTYAKHAANTVAFGAQFPHAEFTMHEPNEYINLDDLFMSSVIYAHAIKLLGELDEN